MPFYDLLNLTFDDFVFILFLVIFSIPLFVGHELAHKLAAQYFDAWAEFRVVQEGALITAISVISPIKFVAPGAVFIDGAGLTQEKSGKISAVGPLSNLVMAGVFISLSPISGTLATFFLLLSQFSIHLAFFNMLPFGVLDGNKILAWNQNTYIALLAMVVIGWLLGNPYFLSL